MHNFLCIVYVQNNMPFFARLIPRLDSIPVFKDCYINTFRVFIFRSPTNIIGDFFSTYLDGPPDSLLDLVSTCGPLFCSRKTVKPKVILLYFFLSRVGSIINKNERQITQL